jgi:DNA-binding Lrp family transcriptional regulator
MTDNLQIDNLDRKILDIITKNARIPYLEVEGNAGFQEQQSINVFSD